MAKAWEVLLFKPGRQAQLKCTLLRIFNLKMKASEVLHGKYGNSVVNGLRGNTERKLNPLSYSKLFLELL